MVVVWYDATRAGLSHPVIFAIVAGALPLLGWLYYARVRAPEAPPAGPRGDAVPAARPGALQRLLNPFAGQRRVLLTRFSPDECSERLRQSRVSLLAPSSWLALNRDRPVHGRVYPGGFALKRRHPMTREGLITQMSGRHEGRAGGTLIRVRFGLSVFDRVFTFVWIGIGGLYVFLFSTPSRAFGDVSWVAMLPVLIFVFVFLLIRLIALDDDVFLYRFLLNRLEADDVTEHEPA